ncbi:hypothetical protein N8524_04550 [Candidatus Puniceispirillum sp.]|nr:hypothetical protein [Candidatus Puniceispirillum sp.]
MPVLREDSVLIMDGAVKLHRRARSRKWPIDKQDIRISTGKSVFDFMIEPPFVDKYR